MAVSLWTIGHSTRTFDDFLALLRSADIEALADVRRFPGSRRLPHFAQDALSQALAQAGVVYEHVAELGGRRQARKDSPNTAWRDPAFRGYADYMMTDAFRAGIARLLVLAEQKRTAIMCAEALWWQCHRGLIADHLKAGGHDVWHILGPGKIEPHPFTSAARIVDEALSYASPEGDLFGR
jgi:uncharacterized protein (DUF488 family)